MPYEYTTNYEWFVDEEATAKLLEGRKLFIFGRDGWSSRMVTSGPAPLMGSSRR